MVGSLHDQGIPTWQDITNLKNTQTEAEIRAVLKSVDTSSAVMLISKDFSQSSMILNVEAPLIIDRVNQPDSFFWSPLIADGMSYDDAANLFNGKIGANDLSTWNLTNLNHPKLSEAKARLAAQDIMLKRLEKINDCKSAPHKLDVKFSSRVGLSGQSGYDFQFDWSRHFRQRLASQTAWEKSIIPALSKFSEAVAGLPYSYSIEGSGLITISTAVAIGTAFISTRGISVKWQQPFPNGSVELWGLNINPTDSGFSSKDTPRNTSKSEIAVLVSVTDDVTNDFAKVNLPDLRVVVHVERTGGSAGSPSISGSEASHVAQVVSEAIRAARQKYNAVGKVHLFMAVPVGLALMIGQKLNTISEVQMYEHESGFTIPYQESVLLRP